MPLAHASPRRRSRALASLYAGVVLATMFTGCSATGDTRADEGRDEVEPSPGSDPALDVRTTVDRVHGDLDSDQRRRLEREVESLISGYLSAAYLHERGSAGYRGAFPGFTPDAAGLALEDVRTAADGSYPWATSVRPVAAVALLSVVAPEGRPAGATARVLLRMEATDDRREREVTVRGRLLLTRTAERWQIFGYDLALASTPTKRSGR